MTFSSLILCPSARLARSIQTDIAHQQIQAGKGQWLSPAVLTLSQWLDGVIEEGLLTGAIAGTTAGTIGEQSPPYALSAFNEQLLWKK